MGPSPRAPASPRPGWRDTLWRRARSLTAEAFFHGIAGLASLHPAASPERHGIDVERDVAYGPDPRWHRLDLYRPVHRPGPWPVVFYAHGGAFHLLSKDTHWMMGLMFARFGYLVVNISYRYQRAEASSTGVGLNQIDLSGEWPIAAGW